MESDELTIPDDHPLAAAISDTWGLVPLRVSTGWTVQWNTWHVRRLPSGLFETNDSEDLAWIQKLKPTWVEDDDDFRTMAVDVGWYRDTFRAVVLDPGWDNIYAKLETTDLTEVVATVEKWFQTLPAG